MAASKSTSTILCESHQRGLEAEIRVQEQLIRNQYRILKHRFKTPYGEIDLLVESPKGGWVMLEVKCLGKLDWMTHRITPRQYERLQGLQLYIESRYEVSVSLWAAYVMPRKILYVPL